VDDPHYVAKRLDRKAKTADCDSFVPLLGRTVKVAGLVVGPTLPGFSSAFRGDKLSEAREAWNKFAPNLAPPLRPDTEHVFMPGGKFYAVEQNPAAEHYGAVLFSSNSLYSAGKYIHGDYDLYDIVSKENPQQHVAYWGERLGVPHSWGRHFLGSRSVRFSTLGGPSHLPPCWLFSHLATVISR
jgi:hypothetical protein